MVHYKIYSTTFADHPSTKLYNFSLHSTCVYFLPYIFLITIDTYWHLPIMVSNPYKSTHYYSFFYLT